MKTFSHNPAHPFGTCTKCGGEMAYNVPRMGANGGFIHKENGSLLCDGLPAVAVAGTCNNPQPQPADSKELEKLAEHSAYVSVEEFFIEDRDAENERIFKQSYNSILTALQSAVTPLNAEISGWKDHVASLETRLLASDAECRRLTSELARLGEGK